MEPHVPDDRTPNDRAREFGPLVSLNDPAFIHASALVYGKVSLAKGSSLWPYAVIRAENYEIEIGANTNIQDHAMIHVGYNTGTYIGEYCSITHHCNIHGARIGDNCLVGINATIMDNCVIGDNCIIAGGAFLKEKTVVPDNSIVAGMPAQVIRSRNSWVSNRFNALLYHRNAQHFARGEHRGWDGAEFEAWMRAEMARLNSEFAELYPEGRKLGRKPGGG